MLALAETNTKQVWADLTFMSIVTSSSGGASFEEKQLALTETAALQLNPHLSAVLELEQLQSSICCPITPQLAGVA